jgi:pimeloyl-ACP methyl ester carboxylesterase
MQACIDEAAAQGINLSGYNTNENAADVNSIRQALGYDQIILYGQSYGTQLAQFVMRNHPEILESVILDGILAASSTTEAEYSSHRDAFQRYFTACAADEACNAAYPDPETALAEAYTALEANPQQIETVIGGQPVTLTVDGTLALTVLYSASFGMGRYATVPLAAYQMRDGDWSQLSQALPDVLDPIDYLMHLPMICTDDPNTSLADVDTADTADMYIDVEYEDANRYVSLCPLLNAAPLPDGSDELVVSDIPTLLLQGGLDPATAVANGNIVETGLSNSYNLIFPAGTHIQGTSPCGATIMAAFMADPTTAPDTSCIEQGFAFAVPRTITVSSEDGSASISMDLPAGFQDSAGGGYSSPPVIVTLQVLPPQTPEAAIQAFTSSVGLPDNELVDGDPVAGLPTKRYQADGFESQGFQLGFDIIAFANEAGTYMIIFQNQDLASVEAYRQEKLPALLESVTVGGQ